MPHITDGVDSALRLAFSCPELSAIIGERWHIWVLCVSFQQVARKSGSFIATVGKPATWRIEQHLVLPFLPLFGLQRSEGAPRRQGDPNSGWQAQAGSHCIQANLCGSVPQSQAHPSTLPNTHSFEAYPLLPLHANRHDKLQATNK